MGAKQSYLTEEEIEDFVDLTFLGKHEILHCFNRFRKLDPEKVAESPLGTRLPYEVIISLPELQYNPLRDRLVSVFSSEQDGCLSFEDFLDMASVLSEAAPPQLKADWAFRIFDFDEDGKIGTEDIKSILRRITGNEEEIRSDEDSDGSEGVDSDVESNDTSSALTAAEMEKIAKHVMTEADLNKSNTITAEEFRHTISKSPDFSHNFRLRF